jgi:hypothetical protein
MCRLVKTLNMEGLGCRVSLELPLSKNIEPRDQQHSECPELER